ETDRSEVGPAERTDVGVDAADAVAACCGGVEEVITVGLPREAESRCNRVLRRRACGNDRQRRDERAAVVARALVTRVRDAHARDGFQRVGELEVNLAEARELLVDDAVIRLRVDEPAGAGNEANEISRGRELRVE